MAEIHPHFYPFIFGVFSDINLRYGTELFLEN